MFRAGLNGYQGGSGGQIFDGHTGMWNGLGEQLDCRRGVQSEGRDAQSVDPGRVEMLEALVAQLLRRDAASSADESCHERVDFVHSSSAVTAGRGSFKEGRGSCKTGEPKHRLGKGIGEPYGVRVNPNLRVFQPPWTSFQQEPDAVMSARPTTSGPGDDLLAATRAMQNVTLQEIPELKPYGAVECDSAVPTKLAHGSACQPASVGEGPEVRQAEVGSRPGVNNSGSGNGITGEVTVMVNGVPRIGRFNERGEVVLIPEAPKYFAMHEAGHQVRQATNVAAEDDRGSRDGKPNPFRSDAVSPFRTPTQECGPSASGSPPPPPPPGNNTVGFRAPRAPSRSPNGNRYGGPRKPSRSPNQSPSRPCPAPQRMVNASPATPGGTRLPSGPPPETPPGVLGHEVDLGKAQGLGVSVGTVVGGGVRASDKEYVPGERTYWELPVLMGPTNEPNPAMRCNDWVYKIGPLMSDLAPKANVWWNLVLKEAQEAYQRWSVAKPLDRSKIIGRPSATLQGDRFTRIESRGVAMLSKALPNVVYEQALSSRNVSCVGLLFLTLRIFQPGGLNERAELLRGLTTLQVFETAALAVSGFQKWFRHLERAHAMSISIPDSSLLLDSIDKSVATILQGNPSMNFRMHSVRMQLQLDTMPSHSSVEEYARTILAELELLAVAAPETTSKRQRIASVNADQSKGKASGKQGGTTKGTEASGGDGKGNGQVKKPCTGWITDKGCRFGKSCTFAHTVDRPGKCWACGGSHQKSECTAPGGGKHQKQAGPETQSKGKQKGLNQDSGSSGAKGKTGAPTKASAPGPTGLSQEAIKEAAQLLQSMRLAAIRPYVSSVAELLCRAQRGEPRGLIDGGATACLRTALAHEVNLPTVSVRLACGECSLLVNPQGTLLSKTFVSPILSVRALLSLGYRLEWDSSRCLVWHPVKGPLEIDASSGCPEISELKALELIAEYEAFVQREESRCARLHCIMRDLETLGTEDLAGMIIKRDVHADAALQALLKRVFPRVLDEVLAQAVVSLQDQEGETHAWNRRMRRKCDKSEGLLIHLFRGSNRRVFEGLVERSKVAVLPVDKAEDLLSDNTFRYVLQQASKGRVKGIVASPPYRTFALRRYLTEIEGQGFRPLRVRGESISARSLSDLDCKEQAQRRMDDLLLMRMMILMIVGAVSNRALGSEVPLYAVVHPEDPQQDPVVHWEGRELSVPDTGYATLWATPEWQAVEQFIGLQGIAFRQGARSDGPVRPTRLSTNMTPDPMLVDDRDGFPYLVLGDNAGRAEPRDGVKATINERWSDWSGALQTAICNMFWREFREKGLWTGYRLQAFDAGFIEHVRNGHVPYRKDCEKCLRGGARHRQHRKVLAPQAWTLSLDTAGPFPREVDEGTNQAKYLIVAVLTVPILASDGDKVEEPADRDPTITVEGYAQSLEDREWFLERGMEIEDPECEPSQKELKEGKEAWNEWEKVVKRSRKEWMEEAKADYLPKVSMVDFIYTEAVDSKAQQVVLGATSRIYARAIADGFSVRRVHTDRGREFSNQALRNFCQKFGLHQTFAIPEEHQTNGRAEGAILRIKNKTRTILQESDCEDLSEWPLAAKLAAYQLRADARKRLRMPCEPTLPYNTKVQVLKRSWNRGVWDARTTTAFTKCPSADTSRGWVVKTEEGLLFTTSKVFPANSAPDLRFEVKGQPVDLDAPSHRVKEKSKAKKIQVIDGFRQPKSPADILAKQLLEGGCWEPKHIASLAVCMSKTMSSNTRMIKKNETPVEGVGGVNRPTCNFLSGGFTFSGMSGVRCDTKEYSYVTRYLCEYMRNYTDEAFAGIGLSLNSCHSMHRDLHNHREVPNLLLPIVASGGGLWIQDKPSAQVSTAVPAVSAVRRSPDGTELQGHVYQYESHRLLKFSPQVWHESVDPTGPQLLLFGFTARGLHKLSKADRQLLWDTGFPYVPGNKHEFWGYRTSSRTMVRYHPVPRRAMFAPSEQDLLPFSRKCLGDVRLCVQQQGTESPVRLFHRWREGRGRASSAAWTGYSVFTYASAGDPSCARKGGGISQSISKIFE